MKIENPTCAYLRDGKCVHAEVAKGKFDARCIAMDDTGRISPSKCLTFESGAAGKDMVDKPEHYSRYGMETIDALKGSVSPEEFNGFLKGNLFKYLTRAGAKDDLEQDLHKVCWYAAFLYLANGGTAERLQKTCDYMKRRFFKW